MVKYLYGDSTEFPLHQDFLSIIRGFIKTAKETIMLEKSIINAEETIIQLSASQQTTLHIIESFKNDLSDSVDKTLECYEQKKLLEPYSVEIKKFIDKTVDTGIKKYTYESTTSLKRERDKIFEAEREITRLFEGFFGHDPLEINEYGLDLFQKNETNQGTLTVFCKGDIIYQFEADTNNVPFWNVLRRTKEFRRDVIIPIGMKKPLLKKELVPNYVNLNDYVLTNLETHFKTVQMTLKRQISAQVEYFKIDLNYSEDDFNPLIIYVDENGVEHNILAIKELNVATDKKSIAELGRRVMAKAEELIPQRKKLVNASLKGEDVIKNRIVHRLMFEVAHLYAPLIMEIRSRSLSESELILKEQKESGERREIYLDKSEIIEPLNSLGEDGARIIQALKIT